MSDYIKERASLLVIVLASIVFVYIMINTRLWEKDNKVIAWDAISYYAYLPATFIYNDVTLDFIDDYKGEHEFTFWPSKTPEGASVIKTSMGLSMLYSPFFAIGHLHASLTDADAGGYSKPYKFWLMFAALFYLIIGLMHLRWVLRTFVNESVVALVFLLLLFATNMQHYTTIESTMPHVFNFALMAMFMHYTIKWHHSNEFKYIFIIGILSGLITLIRPTNVLIALFFILYNVSKKEHIIGRLKTFWKYKWQLVILILLAITVWMPQLMYWKMVSGDWFYFSYGDERFFFANPQLISGLFGYRKGWLIYTPVMLFALIGLVSLFRHQRQFFWPVLIIFVLHIYIIFSWWSWWYGGSYGSRPMIDIYPLLALPLALLISHYTKSLRNKLLTYSLVALFVFHGIFQTAQYYYGAIHWDSMTREAYWDSFGDLRPSAQFSELLKSPDYEAAKQGDLQAVKDE